MDMGERGGVDGQRWREKEEEVKPRSTGFRAAKTYGRMDRWIELLLQQPLYYVFINFVGWQSSNWRN